MRVLLNPQTVRSLPKEEATNASSITLVALSLLLDSHGSVDVTPVKEALIARGLHDCVAQLCIAHQYAVTEMTPTMKTVRQFWKLIECVRGICL